MVYRFTQMNIDTRYMMAFSLLVSFILYPVSFFHYPCESVFICGF
ncbi:MAG: hypothetical protein QG641_2777 [Candidatus Poribacteria bacterium]|nr:hypothetical protein [Candidatus Poribacteria bacterium]